MSRSRRRQRRYAMMATRGQGRVQPGDSAAVVVTEWEGM
jgi:hypothetical protein